ncbi:MlaD family protein [Flexithrix dorotheae]|uniref:MlaD family protein n=1 Tax=Flexithrix dorotheae TaxID=70993 RepID=UPI000380F048|nr:MlaD family protein [Flexithrix dorotheae]
MKKQNKSRTIKLGVFVTLGVALLVTAMLILGTQSKMFVSKFPLKTTVKNVEGLKEGDNVWFLGVKIGVVKAIEFGGRNSLDITMLLDENIKPLIKKDSKAVISSDGVLAGNKIVSITPGSGNSAAVEEGDEIASEVPFDTDEIITTLSENNDNLADVTRDLKVITERIVSEEGIVGNLISDETASRRFENILQNLEKTTAATLMVTGDLAKFSAKLNDKNNPLQMLMADTSIYYNLHQTVNNFNQVSQDAGQIIEELVQTSQKLNQEDNTIALLTEDEEFAKTLENTMENLEEGSAKLNVNLEAMRENFLFRRYFKKQEKEARKAEKKALSEGSNDISFND